MQHSFCISLKNRGKDHFPVTKKTNLSHHLSALCPPSLQLSFPVSHHPPPPPPVAPSLSFLFLSFLLWQQDWCCPVTWPMARKQLKGCHDCLSSPLLSSLPPLPLPSSSPPPPFFLSFHQSVVSAVTFIWKLPACPQQQEKVKNGENKKAKEKKQQSELRNGLNSSQGAFKKAFKNHLETLALKIS